MRECKLPLRTVLQNFINNVESLEAKKENKEEVYEQEFQELKKLTESLKTHPDYACTEGEKEYNKRKNRYKDILPYDRTRVVLQAFPGVPGSDYINANYIRGASGSRAYIASQGPLPNTVPDFWRMVVECDVQVIIMASNETEGGKHKCECYWVENEGEEKQFGNVLVSFIKSRQVCPDFLVRTLKIKFTTENKTEERTICQFHYMLWPDHGVPDTVRPLLHMVRLVRDCQASETLPVLVHCSAGCGRTGTICAIDYVWGLLRTGKLSENLYLLGLVREMRVQRVAMVQTKEQYTLLHQAVKELFRDRLNLIDSHPYENVSTDGNPIMLQATENKESDYEELLLSQEKQDWSTKSVPSSAPPPPPPSSTSSPIPSTPSGSLNRKESQLPTQRFPWEKADTLRRSASTSSLDTHRVCPALPKDSTHHLPLTSASLDASPCQQKAIHPRLPSFQSESTLHYPRSLTASFSGEESSPSKKPPRVYSKVEKEAENLAQKMETREKEMRNHSSSSLSQKSSSAVGSSSTTAALPEPLSSTTNLPSLTGSVTLNPPPVPPPRSRTPSPIINVRKISSEHQKKGSGRISAKDAHGEKRKSTEIVRRPSIQKLRELFEKSSPPGASSVIECPNGVRLCRSASSVTSRSGLLSLHSDALVSACSLKVKRKASLGSEQSVTQGSKTAVKEADPLKFQICPPPPPLTSQRYVCGDDKESAFTSVVGGKPPSSPVLGNILGVKRKVTQIPCDDSKEEKHLVHFTCLDDRPALPIKKSKSFRWSRSQGSPGSSSAPLDRSPEIPKRRTDLDTYFSLDRGKENSPSSRGAKGESSIKKIANDFFPLHQEGLKLSVYEASINSKPSPNTTSHASEDKIAAVAKTELGRPVVPPKKTAGGDKLSKTAKLLSLQIPLSRSTAQVNDQSSSPALPDHSLSKEAQTPLSAPPNATLSFESKDFWERMRETCFENLYDELPSSRPRPTQKPESTPEGLPNASPNLSHHPPSHSDAVSQSSTLQGSKDYVNARVLPSNFGGEDTPRVSYAPLPSKRESKEKGAHDYANCSVFALPDGKSSRNEEVTSHASHAAAVVYRLHDDTTACKPKRSPEEAIRTKDSACLTTHSSSDYEPVDFGETLTSVDEVFETLNYELIESKSKEKKSREKAAPSRLDYYLNKDLDSLAIQVYQDCQAYLLNGNSRSPVPSLMPKSTGKADQTNLNLSKIPAPFTEASASGMSSSGVTDLEEVRNKVSVPPQGLRNRERRNSYRQAVNTTVSSYGRGGLEKTLDPLKKVHKYEKIWFETMKEEMDEDVGSGGQRDEAEQAASTSGQDFFSNLNHPMNISGKEALFKDKLEELHGLVSNLERKKLPDLSEEELSSRDSGSTSSLISRSAPSSRSSERIDPIYVNVPLAPGMARPSSSPVEPPPGKLQQPPLVKGTSPYGTLATTTSYPYKPRVAPPQQKFGSSGTAGPFKNPPGAATLPAKSTSSPPPPPFPPIQNIPPPLGFGNPVFQAPNPPPVDTSRAGLDNSHEKKPLFPPIFRSQPAKGVGSPGNSSVGSQLDSERNRQKKHHQKTLATTKLTAAFSKGKTHQHNAAGASDDFVSSSSGCKEKEKNNVAAGRRDTPVGLGPGLYATSAHEAISSPPNPSLNPSVYYHAPIAPKLLSRPSEPPKGPNGSLRGNSGSSQGLVPPETSSTDTEDEPPQKTSTSILLRKLKGTNTRAYAKVASTGKNDDGGDSFFSREDKDKESKRGPISPPGSPRAFTKAFGKLKLGSKSVAANFKSYLSSRGNSDPPSDGTSSEVSTRHYPLQKSVSSGPSVNIFSQVVEDSKPPSPLPKKANRELLPHNFRCYDHHSKAEPKTSRARQQYL